MLRLDELVHLSVEIGLPHLELGSVRRERLRVLELGSALGQRPFQLTQSRRLALEIGGGRRQRTLALVQSGLAVGGRLIAVCGTAGKPEGGEPPSLSGPIDLALGAFELSLALPGPLGSLSERGLHPRDLACGGFLNAIPLGGEVALQLLQPP